MSLPCIGGKKTQAYKIKEKKRRNKKKRISIASIRIVKSACYCLLTLMEFMEYLLSVHVSHTLVALFNSYDLLFCCMTELDGSKKNRTSIALLGLSSLHVTVFEHKWNKMNTDYNYCLFMLFHEVSHLGLALLFLP